ncbi:hypothetical protein MNV49_001105 [Pseudohyphozyma bogoriensis]|nr:hypothetical protein MNV49_001105 [Pseudohyphozyma bogoriensis]
MVGVMAHREVLLAVFNNDTPADDINQKYGSYGEMTLTVLNAGLKAKSSDAILRPTFFDVVNGTLPPMKELAKFDGLVLTGSGRALGGKVELNQGGWEIGTTDITLSEAGKTYLETASPTLSMQEVHRDHVSVVPADCINLGGSPATPCQGFVKLYSSAAPTYTTAPNHPTPSSVRILTSQFHPEFTEDIVKMLIEPREESGLFTPELAKWGRENSEKPHDGLVMAEAILSALGL